MIIHEPVKSLRGARVRLSALIESEKQPKHSDTLWFEFPSDLADQISVSVNVFAAAMLPTAMSLGERLFVRRGLSPQLLEGLGRARDLFHQWSPPIFKKIDVLCDRPETEPTGAPGRPAAAAFSGGVDSFFTLISHLPGGPAGPDRDLKYLMFVHGFDIPLTERRTYEIARASYEKMAGGLGLRLIAAATNFRQLRLTRPVAWDMTCGAALFGAALALSPLVSRFYVPATHRHAEHLAQGSHPLLDPNFSTENLLIVHDGIEASRSQKTKVLADFKPSYENLRVCWEQLDGLRNCGRCQKCLRTMLALQLIGVLDRYKTFPKFIPVDVRRWVLRDENDILFAQDVADLASERGDKKLLDDIGFAVGRCRRQIALTEKVIRRFGLVGRRAEQARYLAVLIRQKLSRI